MNSIKVSRKDQSIKAILKATFPEYRGRTISVDFTPAITFHDTNWGGGSRNQYHAIGLNGESQRLSVNAPWANPVEGKRIDMPTTALIVKHSIFCGHDLGITIYAHPQNAPRWLPAG